MVGSGSGTIAPSIRESGQSLHTVNITTKGRTLAQGPGEGGGDLVPTMPRCVVSRLCHTDGSGMFGKLRRFKSNSQSPLSPLH